MFLCDLNTISLYSETDIFKHPYYSCHNIRWTIRRKIMDTTSLIYNTLTNLTNAEPGQYAQIRQALYDQLDLPFDKKFALYSNVLGPVGAGKLENLDKAMTKAYEILEDAH